MPDQRDHRSDLVEPEGVNAGPPVDEPEGDEHGELLSRPHSRHGLTTKGPGQELSAGEG